MSWHLDGKFAELDRQLFTKANAWDLDAAKAKIRELEQDLSREVANRQSLEARLEQLAQRLDVLESAAQTAAQEAT